VLQRLDRRLPAHPPGPVTSWLAAFFTLGLWPLLRWPHRWNELIDEHQPDLIALAAWWRRRLAPQAVKKMDRAVEDLQTPWVLLGIPTVIFWFVLVVFATVAFQRGLNFDYFQYVTYSWDKHGRYFLQSLDDLHLHQLWLWALFAGYAALWIGTRRHVKAVRSIMTIAHRAGGGVGRPAGRDMIDGGVSFLWIVAAIIFCANSAWWGIPFALAGAIQRRYTVALPVVRSILANQVRIALHDGGDMGAPPTMVTPIQPVVGSSFCQTRGCGARLPSVANYCSRCGASATQWNA
jgi:hypothetical protein